MSDNIRAYLISLSPDYTKSITGGTFPLPVSFVLKRRQTPIDKLEQHSVNLLFRRMVCLWECCMDKQHLFKEEQIKHAYLMWLLDLANIYHRKEDNNHKNEVKPDRKKILFVKFMNLLPIHAREEHSLGFYASALCVTPQYLNRVVKNYSGKTVGEWLYQTLVGLITKQLETTDDSMQKIAMDFHFIDQSALAKFYKRQTGYSLTEYKKGKVHI